MPSDEALDDGQRADKIVAKCLEMIQGGLGKLPKDLDPRDLVDVANVARAVSAIRARPKPKEERDYESLVEEVKKDPELMKALGLRAEEPDDQRREEGADDVDADE